MGEIRFRKCIIEGAVVLFITRRGKARRSGKLHMDPNCRVFRRLGRAKTQRARLFVLRVHTVAAHRRCAFCWTKGTKKGV